MSQKTKKFQRKKEDFICENCGFTVKGTGFTNHCPKCLYSKHVDTNPGDRKNECHGILKPIASLYSRDSYTIQHECQVCGEKVKVKASADDNIDLLISLTSNIMYDSK